MIFEGQFETYNRMEAIRITGIVHVDDLVASVLLSSRKRETRYIIPCW